MPKRHSVTKKIDRKENTKIVIVKADVPFSSHFWKFGGPEASPQTGQVFQKASYFGLRFPTQNGIAQKVAQATNTRPKKTKKRAKTTRRDPLHHPISLKNQWVFDVFKKNKKEKRSMESIFSQVAAQRPRNDKIWYPGGSQGVPIWKDTFSKMGPGQASENRHFPDLTGAGPKQPKWQKFPPHTRSRRSIWP